MAKRIVIGLFLGRRVTTAPDVQSVLTEYGCHIKTRIGLHNVDDMSCSGSGLILLEMYGDESKINEMEEKLKSFEGVEIQKMVFEE
ncbi:MAG: hypothetical protein ABFD46_09435 [Armatimonadota bacterium]